MTSETQGSIGGTVVAAQDGQPLPGTALQLLHEPTGTRYSAITRNNGTYLVNHLRIGGPYQVTATLAGFETAVRNGVEVFPEQTTKVDFQLVPSP